MARVIPAAYRHEQTLPATEWVITHNLHGSGASVPIVDVFVDVDGLVQKIIPASIEIVDNTTVRVTFSVLRSGFAIVLV